MKIYTDTPEGFTVIQNAFIDQYMPYANGEFVKVYLYLLRCANTGRDVSLSSIADVFEHTEKDIQRALLYWEKQELLQMQMAPDGTLTALTFLEARLPQEKNGTGRAGSAEKPGRTLSGQMQSFRHTALSQLEKERIQRLNAGYHVKQVQGVGAGLSGMNPAGQNISPSAGTAASGADHVPSSMTADRNISPSVGAAVSSETGKNTSATLIGQRDLKQIFFIAEQYLQRPLTASEQNDFVYYYDELHFSVDLLEYLVEYCISKGSSSRHYMRKVALSWAEAGISTVTQAKQETNLFNKNYFTIFNAFGIKGRNPAPAEQEVMSRWLNEFKFPMEIILEACTRTISQTHQPSFQYADRILSKWHKSGVKSLNDIKLLDVQRIQEQKKQQQSAQTQPQKAAQNRFNNFSQRDYDYDQLERQLLNP